MKIAIHHHPGSYSDEWINYCQQNKIQYKLVNCYDSDIIRQLEDCNGLMWNWAHCDFQAILFARQLVMSIELVGKKVFPDINTCWHFDDKVGQKYLFEANNIPFVNSHVFYDKDTALQWCKHTTYPKVFKLRKGASSANVKLVTNVQNAKRLINISFSKGFSAVNRYSNFTDCLAKYKKVSDSIHFFRLLRSMVRLFVPTRFEKINGREIGYVYFQDFIPNNSFDIRIMVIGNRAYGTKRMVRKNDFRASGGGLSIYDPTQFDKECIKIAFDVKSKIKAQSVAFDFIFQNGKPLITEISYSSVIDHFYPGYWDNELNWHDNLVYEETTIIEEFIKSLSSISTLLKMEP
jgi:glutathione synthase/RimK-type ligase-like ATP-grasp enzyme